MHTAMSKTDNPINFLRSAPNGRPGDDDDVDLGAEIPSWRIAPCTYKRTITSIEELRTELNKYFHTTHLAGKRPTLTDVAGIAGYESITQMINEARRKGGKTMRYISQACLAVQAGYEELAQNGSRTATFLLERIPEFDTVERASQTPSYHFKQAKDIALKITGVVNQEEQGREFSPEESYARLMKCRTYEEAQDIIDVEESEDGTFAALDIDSLPE